MRDLLASPMVLIEALDLRPDESIRVTHTYGGELGVITRVRLPVTKLLCDGIRQRWARSDVRGL
jgi:hypothetical protein